MIGLILAIHHIGVDLVKVLQEQLSGIQVGHGCTKAVGITGIGILDIDSITGAITGHRGWAMYTMDMVTTIMDGANRTHGIGVMDIMVETICMVEDLT
tara:strand:- start:200 stop:493 length:294 start_codon:yes stop_codon:yes gene_type:complete